MTNQDKDMTMRKCLAGPFVGEFGWELFCWQGFLRKRRPEFDHMTVLSRPGRGVLYEDFADEFIEINVPFNNVNMWMGGINVEPIISYHKQQGEYTDFIPFDSYKSRWWIGPGSQTKQVFVPYGNKNGPDASTGYKCIDILMHVRNAQHCNSSFRNWRYSSATAYADWALDQGYSVACVGKSATACHIPGTVDYLDVSLRHEIDIFAGSRMIIGSQSGPHHLATLCRLPIVAWQTKPEHVDRLSKYWNPFNVKIWTNPADISYWKTRKYYQPNLEWMQQCTREALA